MGQPYQPVYSVCIQHNIDLLGIQSTHSQVFFLNATADDMPAKLKNKDLTFV